MKPYNDKDMKYDTATGRYVVTLDGVLNNIYLEQNILSYLKGLSNVELLFREISEDIYRYVLSTKFTKERKYIKHLMNTDPKYRNHIKFAMLYQLRYATRSAGNILKDMHGVDIERGRHIPLIRIRGKVGISESAYEELATAELLGSGSMLDKIMNIDTSEGWF